MEKVSGLRVFQSAVSAGFPSVGDDEIDGLIDLNEMLIKHPAATFFLRVIGNSMIGAGIFEGDVLIVDRSLTAVSGKVVIASLNGELTVKRLLIEGKKVALIAENVAYPPIEIGDAADFRIFGVVTSVIHAL